MENYVAVKMNELELPVTSISVWISKTWYLVKEEIDNIFVKFNPSKTNVI